MARIGISKFEPPVLTAPSLVWFEAEGLDGFDVPEGTDRPHDPSFARVTYVWTVEGGALARYEAPNIPEDWNTPARAYGKKVAFIFTDEETEYRIKLWAIDESGHIGEAETTVRTVASSGVYPAEQTVCLDPSGRFELAPKDATKVTTLADMQGALKAAPGPARVLIARGQVIKDALFDGARVNFIGSFGDPDQPRPVLMAVDYAANMFEFGRTNQSQVTIEALDCRGEWDAATETGRMTNSPLDFSAPSVKYFTVWNCRFSGFGTIEVQLDPETAWTGGIGDTEVTNWGGYGIYVQPVKAESRLAVIGCDLAQHPDAINHYPGNRNNLRNTQGPIRVPECDSVYFGASSFLSRTGWSGADDQNCLRLNSACVEGHSYVVERCTLEGGWGPIHMAGSNGRLVDKAGNYLLDKVLLLAGGGKSFRFATLHFGGTTFRNTIMAQLDVPSADTLGYAQCVPMVPDHGDADNLAAPVSFYNCSVMNLRSAAHDDGDSMRLTAEAPFLNFTAENNVIHAPALRRFPQDDQAPISTTTPLRGFIPRYRGIRPNFRLEEGALERPVSMGDSFALPYPEGTDQAYWLNLPRTDNLHGIRMHRRTYRADEGLIDVRFDPASVVITNRTDLEWEAGWKWILRLDRKSQLPPIDTRYGNPTDREIPLPVPDTGSPAILSGVPNGTHAYDDFLGRVRPGPSETGRVAPFSSKACDRRAVPSAPRGQSVATLRQACKTAVM